MDYQRLCFIVNPGAGSADDILQLIPKVFEGSNWQWELIELKPNQQPSEAIKPLLSPNTLIAVCGGDGSITEAASAVIGTTYPLAIIPGGTANVLARELEIPLNAEDALVMLRERQFKMLTMDTGTVNGKPFFLRINLGIMTDMITETNPDLKEKVGQLAYGVSALKTIFKANPEPYTLNIDGEITNVEGVSLTVTNSGHMGVGNMQLQPGISITDGLLDMVLLKDADFFSIAKVAGSALFDADSDAVIHRTCRNITITSKKEEVYLCDDCEARATQLDIKVVPASLNVIVPANLNK